MLGAGAPALAAPVKAKGKTNAPGQNKAKPKPDKPAKTPAQPKPKKNVGITGGGTIPQGEFSVQAKPGSKARGHFNFTTPDDPATTADESTRVRCKGFDRASYAGPTAEAPNTASATFTNCKVNGASVDPIPVSVTDGSPDTITFTVPGTTPVVVSNQALTDGNVKVRP